MTRNKHFDATEKRKFMAWYFDKIPAEEITRRLNKDLSAVHCIIRLNMYLE
jgi:hypothetical protein